MNPIFCAIDTTDLDKATRTIGAIAPHVGGVKLGLEFFTHHGVEGVKRAVPEGLPLFLDLKFHDIPNTVAGAVKALKGLNIHMFTLHASGGEAMMIAARDAAKMLTPIPRVLGVTVLTSMDAGDMNAIGVSGEVEAQVLRLGELAKRSGIDGAVCSPHEIATLRNLYPLPHRGRVGVGAFTAQSQSVVQACPPPSLPPVGGGEFLLVVPGIRPEGAAKGDQKRVMTPKEALALGASYLVIGRPITDATDPAKAAKNIMQSL